MDEELEQLLGRYRPAGPQNAMRNEVLTGMKRRAWWLRARGGWQRCCWWRRTWG